eukprot:g61019.t1
MHRKSPEKLSLLWLWCCLGMRTKTHSKQKTNKVSVAPAITLRRSKHRSAITVIERENPGSSSENNE